MSAIKVEHLSKSFGKIKAVDDISFEVNKAEIFAFLGPNGAGKTTTIKALCCLHRPTSGTVTVNGFDVAASSMDVRKSIGIIFQESTLDERLTAQENLDFHGMIYHLPGKVRKDRIGEVLDLVGLSNRRKDIVRTFSGGMKRRLEIARGLMHRPRILFLDEPTLGLDPQTRKHVWDYVLELSNKEEITIFFSTNYIDEAEICDRLAIIDHGKVVELDQPELLKKKYAVSSLNDVFLKVTGYNIRHQEADFKDSLKSLVRRKRL